MRGCRRKPGSMSSQGRPASLKGSSHEVEWPQPLITTTKAKHNEMDDPAGAARSPCGIEIR